MDAAIMGFQEAIVICGFPDFLFWWVNESKLQDAAVHGCRATQSFCQLGALCAAEQDSAE